MKRKNFTRAVTLALMLLIIVSPCASQPITLVAVGDSLTEGDGDDGSGGGYPARVLTMLQTAYPGSTLSNRAISGDTAQDLISKQFANAVSDLNAAPAGNRKIALVWIGSNDLFGLYQNNVSLCAEYYSHLSLLACEDTVTDESCANVNTILSDIRATGASIYIALLDDQSKRPVIADVSVRNGVFPGITDDEVTRMSAQIANYNNKVKIYAAAHGATTADFFNTTIFENSSALSSDGNHPNGAGYDAIARIWYQAITGSATTTTIAGTTTTTVKPSTTTTTVGTTNTTSVAGTTTTTLLSKSPDISVSPPAFSDPMSIAAMIDAPGEFTTGLAFDGTYLWSADSETKKIYKLSTAGEIIAGFEITGDLPFGIASDGTSLWYSEFVTGKIYQTDTSGKSITSFDSPGGWSSGLAFDGTYLYASNFESKQIYKMDTDGKIISSFASPGDYPTGLTFDGTYLWNSDSKSGKVYKLDTEGNVIAMFEPYLLYKPYGIAFEGDNVWIADDDSDKLYKLSFTSPVIKMGESKTRTFIVSNSGDTDLHVSKLLITGKDSADFSVQNDRCTGQSIPATRSDNFDIVFSPMSAGEKSAILGVYSDDPDTPLVTVPLNGIGDGLGYRIDTDLWIRAVIHSEEKGNIEAAWYKGGQDKTEAGDQVIWGYFHASPDDVNWGSKDNPDVFVKIWFDRSGRLDVNFFHVSVPDIEVYSDYHYDGIPDEQGTTTLSRRYIRQYYEDGMSSTEENEEDGTPLPGDNPPGNPSGYSAINDLRIGAVIATLEKGPVDALWHNGGDSVTEGGHQVLWGYFYANPDDVSWGSENNPDLFVKVWFDAGGRLDVNFFHVSVPDIEVCSDFPNDGTYNQKGTAVLSNRYIWQVYQR